MGALTKTLAIGGVLGAGYVALRLIDLLEEDEGNKSTSQATQSANSSPRSEPSTNPPPRSETSQVQPPSSPAVRPSPGAVRFYDPRAQFYAHRRWLRKESPRRHCHPLVILERWAFDLPWARSKGPCKLNRHKPGRSKQQWVGPIPGVDAYRLMLMRPATEQHQAMYEAARKLIASRLLVKTS